VNISGISPQDVKVEVRDLSGRCVDATLVNGDNTQTASSFSSPRLFFPHPIHLTSFDSADPSLFFKHKLAENTADDGI